MKKIDVSFVDYLVWQHGLKRAHDAHFLHIYCNFFKCIFPHYFAGFGGCKPTVFCERLQTQTCSFLLDSAYLTVVFIGLTKRVQEESGKS